MRPNHDVNDAENIILADEQAHWGLQGRGTLDERVN